MTNHAQPSPAALRELATRVHAASLETLLDAYEQAASDGLCAEGAWEVAVARLRALNLDALLPAEAGQRGGVQ